MCLNSDNKRQNKRQNLPTFNNPLFKDYLSQGPASYSDY